MLVLGIVLALAGLGMSGGDMKSLSHSYVFGWVFWSCLTFGCLGLTLLHHTCRGHWGFPVLRIFESGGGVINLAFFGLAFLPVATLWLAQLYPWANPGEVAIDPILQYKAPYLNQGFWTARYVFYFLAFIFFAWRYKSWTEMEEKTGDEKWWKKRQYWGGVHLVLFIVFTNFLWTDFLMSMYPHWYSTIYGVWMLVGSVLLAFALTGIILGTQAKKRPYSEVVSPWLTKDIGNWMLVGTMLWAYFSLSQYLIIWSGNLPEFTEYFIARAKNYWGWLGTSLITLHFFVPFLMLLSPKMKREPMRLAFVGFYLIAVRVLDVAYVVLPTWKPSVANVNLLDAGMWLLFGGAWCLLFGWQLAKSPLLTARIPRLKEALEHA